MSRTFYQNRRFLRQNRRKQAQVESFRFLSKVKEIAASMKASQEKAKAELSKEG